MRWIRQHIRSATWLALAALAVQVVVTFGHVHAERFSAPSASATAVAAAGASDKAKAADGPTQPYRARGADSFCAICASIGLLGTLVLPAAQKLTPARVIVRISKAKSAGTNTAGGLRSSSPARAPPVA
jgi:hypothetical protein